jgi:hypothetical protein
MRGLFAVDSLLCYFSVMSALGGVFSLESPLAGYTCRILIACGLDLNQPVVSNSEHISCDQSHSAG